MYRMKDKHQYVMTDGLKTKFQTILEIVFKFKQFPYVSVCWLGKNGSYYMIR